jgi:translocation and assembly module TamB
VEIGRLAIANGLFQFKTEQFHINTILENFSLSTRYEPNLASYLANLAYDKARLHWKEHQWPYGLALSLRLSRQALRIQKATLTFANAALDFTGEVRDWSAPHGLFHYQANLPISVLKPFYPERASFSGGFQVTGRLQLRKGAWMTSGALSGKDLSINNARVGRFSSDYVADPEKLLFSNLVLAGLGGEAEGSFGIRAPLAVRDYQADLKFKKVDLMALSALTRLDRYRLAGSLNGRLQASWRDGWKDFSGRGNLNVESLGEERILDSSGRPVISLTGQLEFVQDRWSSTFHQSYLALANSRMDFSGTLSPSKPSDLRFRISSGDLRDFAFLGVPMGGTAQFEGVVQGSLESPELGGNLELAQFSLRELQLDHFRGGISASRQGIQLQRALLTQNQSSLNFSGRIGFLSHSLWQPGEVELEAGFARASVQDLLGMVGRKAPLEAQLTGQCRIRGEFPAITVEGSASAQLIQWQGQLFDSGQFQFQASPQAINFSQLQLRLGAGSLTGTASFDIPSESLQANLTGSGLPLERISQFKSNGVPVEGSLENLEVKASGRLPVPALSGSFLLKNIRMSGEPLGDFHVEIRNQDGLADFIGSSVSSPFQLNARGTVVLEDPYELKARISFTNFRFTPYVRKLLAYAPENLSSSASGDIWVAGNLSQFRKLKWTGTLSALAIQLQEARLQTTSPLEFTLEDSTANIKRGEFAGKGTALTLEGLADLGSSGRLDLKLAGQFDLALASEFIPKLTARGEGRLNANIRGTLKDPRIRGFLNITNGQLSYGDLPNSLTELQATLNFDENQVRIARLEGTSGGGKIQAEGNLAFSQKALRQINIKILGRNVRLRYPEGMRNVVDTDLSLRGNPEALLLSGNVNVTSAGFLKDYDPITAFIENRGRRIELPLERGIEGNLNLDLNITADRSIRLDSNLVKLTSRADLRLRGTLANPSLTGSLDATEGDLYFQGAHYRITRGRLDFFNPNRFDPLINLEAETIVRDYRVVLTLNGTGDKFKADLRSDPPLPTMEVISLVSSGGAASQEISRNYTSRPFAPNTGLQQDASASAAALLSEGLSLKVGSRVKRLFGIDRFRVDPGLFGRQNERTARVTVGQQITRNLSITYSTTVAANEQQVILVEYDFNDSTSIIASRDAEGFFGIDLRFRKRFHQPRR